MNYKENSFPMIQNGTNITSGSTNNGGVWLCADAGDLRITYKDDSTKVVSCISGNSFDFLDAIKVEVLTGTFHIG